MKDKTLLYVGGLAIIGAGIAYFATREEESEEPDDGWIPPIAVDDDGNVIIDPNLGPIEVASPGQPAGTRNVYLDFV